MSSDIDETFEVDWSDSAVGWFGTPPGEGESTPSLKHPVLLALHAALAAMNLVLAGFRRLGMTGSIARAGEEDA